MPREPMLSTEVDRWLISVLGVDPLLQTYCPGGCWAQRPPQKSTYPLVRWWLQSPGNDVLAQDGQLGRIESCPRVVVCILDRQMEGQIDLQYGTYGASLTPKQNYYELAAKRVGTLLHARSGQLNGFSFTSWAIQPYQLIDPSTGGYYDVMLGNLYQLSVQ